MRTLLPLMKTPISPPAANSSTDESSAARKGRAAAASGGAASSPNTTARPIGRMATPPPRRMAHVSSARCSTEAMS